MTAPPTSPATAAPQGRGQHAAARGGAAVGAQVLGGQQRGQAVEQGAGHGGQRAQQQPAGQAGEAGPRLHQRPAQPLVGQHGQHGQLPHHPGHEPVALAADQRGPDPLVGPGRQERLGEPEGRPGGHRRGPVLQDRRQRRGGQPAGGQPAQQGPGADRLPGPAPVAGAVQDDEDQRRPHPEQQVADQAGELPLGGGHLPGRGLAEGQRQQGQRPDAPPQGPVGGAEEHRLAGARSAGAGPSARSRPRPPPRWPCGRRTRPATSPARPAWPPSAARPAGPWRRRRRARRRSRPGRRRPPPGRPRVTAPLAVETLADAHSTGGGRGGSPDGSGGGVPLGGGEGDVPREQQLDGPVDQDPQPLLRPGQLPQVDAAPQQPGGQAGEAHAAQLGGGALASQRHQEPEAAEAERLGLGAGQGGDHVVGHGPALADRVLGRGRAGWRPGGDRSGTRAQSPTAQMSSLPRTRRVRSTGTAPPTPGRRRRRRGRPAAPGWGGSRRPRPGCGRPPARRR